MKRFLLFCALCGWVGFRAGAQTTLDTIGVTALLAADPTLTGSGQYVAQAEATNDTQGLQFEVNPGSPGQPVKLFTYRGRTGSAGTFPNNVGSESTHGDAVAEALYGEYTGVAPGLRHVANDEALYFLTKVITLNAPSRERVFNQSFVIGPHDASYDLIYDNYIALYHTVIVTAAGNSGTVTTPADCYNGLGVAAYGGASAVGPSTDGRCKPDITAPAPATSFSTPLVSGAAAVLMQEGQRMGINAAAAIDPRTIKALLLNGAEKPSDWTHTATAPLDPNYGAGVLNVYNSYEDLKGGRHGPAARMLSAVATHAPLTSGVAGTVARGWDYRAIASSATEQAVNHYRITTSGTGALISTLVWNKGYNATGINRLGLYVYDSGGTLLGSSVSTVDNVQHLYITGLTPGTYDLEVVKNGGKDGTPGMVSGREIYSLAWDFER